MRRLFKWTFRLALVLGALFLVLWFSKNSIVRAFAERRIKDDTGLRVTIGRLSAAVSSAAVTLENVKVYNTPEFGGALFLDLPRLYVQVDPAALSRRKLRLTRMQLDLAQVTVVRNQSGQTNIFSFANEIGERKKANRRRGDRDDFEFDGIEKLQLSLGKATFLDLGNPAANAEIPLNMRNQVFPEVRSEADVYAMLFMIWLRSGGKFSIGPNDLARDYLERRKDELEAAFRETMQQASDAAPR